MRSSDLPSLALSYVLIGVLAPDHVCRSGIPRQTCRMIPHYVCLDIIRQALQCSGSTTLNTTKFMEGIQHSYINSDQLDVCRLPTFLRDWIPSQLHGGGGYIERNLESADERKFRIVNAFAGTHTGHDRGGRVP